LSSNN